MQDEPLPRVLLLAGRLEVRARSAYTLRLAQGLPEEGYEPTVVCADASRLSYSVREPLGIRIYKELDRPAWGLVVRAGLLRDLQEEPPDLVHVQDPAMLGCGTYLAKRLGVPAIVTFPSAPYGIDRFTRPDPVVRRAIAISKSVAADLLGVSRFPADRLRVIHSGVDADDQPLHVLPPGRVPVVGSAGPLESPKGLPYFLGAAARVKRRFPECRFLLSGAGPEESNLRRVARELNLENAVTFAPNLLDFSAGIAATDIFCLPSLSQGLGATMLEAMSRGRPVVASGVGGVDSVIEDGVTGLIVPPARGAPLAEKICELLADPEAARRIGAAGRAVVQERFGVARMVKETAALYGEALAEWIGDADD
ncbi:glycosyltransferase family 4 protein [Alienimonas chondri]|uniref:D-inositol-3-phosphate glycosyltransferase n=1 Tax=Alienimonas chondri TaxID=2681879 RepID=A0ABX1VBZ9_9PLAN|nr:glycosyltransferase family 4 protein [Alienimonas chondri]NNJ24586.1 D-inositol-3-phosphate glycosyltransferase [Alienimonas chondri]